MSGETVGKLGVYTETVLIIKNQLLELKRLIGTPKIMLKIWDYKTKNYILHIESTHVPRKGDYIEIEGRDKSYKVTYISWNFNKNEVFIGVKG